ncbi:MAG: O-methyltransferase [Ignavibacteriales bacterium]|jgi:Predicted O-methyltransferase|nr:MAG: O-methyltransferase [Ignavibacteriaceae bacterium]MBW7873196.1 O-methyltransferase [Ignavibacteria bacterium]MCZ2142838.1 O-methyltransferase [Ignavibacteriales bacterium]MBV6443932.1 hypothetical protein [Ignavibacteriaceae bacterium]MBZ0196225.1 O-methyltransferase [Ignavibacteriaceae bacterium]
MPDILTPETTGYLNSVRGKQTPLIAEMEKYAEENHVPILDPNSAAFLEVLVKSSNAGTVLEIGTAIAYTTTRIAAALPEKGMIYTIEKSADMIPLAQRNIEASGVKHKIKLLQGEAFHHLLNLDIEFDLIFLDADKEDYKRLFELSLPLLKKGGLYIVDNLLWHGYTAFSGEIPQKYLRSTGMVREFNQIFLKSPALQTSLIPIGDGLGLGYKLTEKGEDTINNIHMCYKNFDLIVNNRMEEPEDMRTLLELTIEGELEKNFEEMCFDAKYMIGLGSSIAKAEESPDINSYGTMKDDLSSTILKFLGNLKEILAFAEEKFQLYFINKYLQQNEEDEEMEDLLRLVSDFAEMKLIINELKRT